jgi:CheY-like chemotaxis protein
MKENYILWIEDDKIFLDRTIPLLEKEGFCVEGVASGKEGVKKIQENYFKYSLVLLDLEMPEMDGIKTYNAIKKVNSQVPIIIVSAHLGEPLWESRLKSLDVEKIGEPLPMITSDDFTNIIKLMKKKQMSNIKSRIDPFKYSYDEFMKLADDEMDRVIDIASEVNFIFKKKFFDENPDKDWIVIAKQAGNIVASGKNEDEPFDEDLEELAKKYKAPVFTYSRNKIIEQIDTVWNCTSESDDYYPTVTIAFVLNGKEHRIKGDFDTGSSHSFLSYEKLMDSGILKKKPLLQASASLIWGGEYKYYRKRLKCDLLGRVQRKEIELTCEIVKNWKDSPLAAS